MLRSLEEMSMMGENAVGEKNSFIVQQLPEMRIKIIKGKDWKKIGEYQRVNFFIEKDDGKPGDYLCPDCGYVFTKGPAAWQKLPEDYRCPPCGAPKFRFKKVPKGSQSGKVEVKKSWF